MQIFLCLITVKTINFNNSSDSNSKCAQHDQKAFVQGFESNFILKNFPYIIELGKDNVWINLEIWTRKSWFCINHKLASCLVHNCYVAFYDCTKNYYYTYIYNNILLQKLTMTACFIQEESSGAWW